MPLRAPHEYKVNRSTGTLVDLREYPIREFRSDPRKLVGYGPDGSKNYVENPEYHSPILYQSGKFYRPNGEEMPKKDVPPYILAQLRSNPPQKDNLLTQRELRMSFEEAEKLFGPDRKDEIPQDIVHQPRRKQNRRR